MTLDSLHRAGSLGQSGPKPIPQTAAEWCARMHSESVTPTDRAAFAEWIAAAPGHRKEYDDCETVMRLSRALAAHPDLVAAAGLEQDDPRAVERPRSPWRLCLMAASVAAALVIGGLTVWQQSRPVDYATLVGEQKTVLLDDGSRVDLNTDTRFDVRFDSGERHVKLLKGEAFFDVSPDAARPFVIAAGPGEIRVVGTKFNVRVEGGDTVVTVLEGHVRVAAGQEGAGRDGAGGETVDLYPNDQLRMDARGRLVKTVTDEAPQIIAWRNGQVYFESATLAQVIAELNRYSARKYVIRDRDLAALKLSGVFKTHDPDAILFVLRETFGIAVQSREGNAINLGLPGQIPAEKSA